MLFESWVGRKKSRRHDAGGPRPRMKEGDRAEMRAIPKCDDPGEEELPG
jgi:hypothetical protein